MIFELSFSGDAQTVVEKEDICYWRREGTSRLDCGASFSWAPKPPPSGNGNEPGAKRLRGQEGWDASNTEDGKLSKRRRVICFFVCVFFFKDNK